jgi:hypothetical protein
MPSWKQVLHDFADDPGIIIASLDCEKHGRLCSIFGVRGYPSFYSVFRNSIVRPQLRDRTYQSFVMEVNRLKGLASDQFVFAERVRRMKYPIFVFRLSKTDSLSQEIATRVALDSNLALDSRFTFDFDSSFIGHPSVVVLFSSQVSRVHKDNFDYEHISRFIGDNPIVPFGDWTLDKISKVLRLFAICIPAAKQGIPEQTVEWAKRHEDEALFGSLRSIGKKACAKVFQIAPEMQPAVVFVNISASTFHVVKSATPEELDQFLRAVKNSEAQMGGFDLNVLHSVGDQWIIGAFVGTIVVIILAGTSYVGWIWLQERWSIAKVE